MGQLYSNLNSLLMNDVDTAADPNRRREKLETTFVTPKRLPDPRSPTQEYNRTPIYATTTSDDAETPKLTATRPRFLETDLDGVATPLPEGVTRLRARIMTSTPTRAPIPSAVAAALIDSVLEEARDNVFGNQVSAVDVLDGDSYASKSSVDSYCSLDESDDIDSSTRAHCNNTTQASSISGSIHNDSDVPIEDFAQFIQPANGIYNDEPMNDEIEAKNALNADVGGKFKKKYPSGQEDFITSRTPLGDVSVNSPTVVAAAAVESTKSWKNVAEERAKRGVDVENTPPRLKFAPYSPNVVQSAPAKLNRKTIYQPIRS